MNKDLTEIVVVLDKSGSMGSIRQDTIGGFNTFLNDQKELPGEAVFTFVTFDTDYKFVEQGTLLENVKELNTETYSPGGLTALLDAVGKTINDVISRHATLPEEEKPGQTIFVVLTDGEENSSKEFLKSADISKMIKEREAAGWEILFLGADIDAWGDGQKMGFSKSRGINKDDMFMNFSKMSNYTASYRSAGSADMGTFDLSKEDLDKQMKDLKGKK